MSDLLRDRLLACGVGQALAQHLIHSFEQHGLYLLAVEDTRETVMLPAHEFDLYRRLADAAYQNSVLHNQDIDWLDAVIACAKALYDTNRHGRLYG